MNASTRKSQRTVRDKRTRALQLMAAIGATLAAGTLPPSLGPLSQKACAFNPPIETVGPLTVELSGAAPVTQLEQPMALSATLSNSGAAPLRGTLQFLVADDWRVLGNAQTLFTLAPGEKKTVPFQVVAGKASLAALYPIHARAVFRVGETPASTREVIAEAIAVVPVASEAVAARNLALAQAPNFSLPPNSALRLDDTALFTTRIAVNGRAEFGKPVGWTGSDESSGAEVRLAEANRGGGRRALWIHPPWKNGWGQTLADYHVTLPAGGPISLRFATAIRDSQPGEPQSDGVEFRVLASDGNGWQTLFTRFSQSKTWEEARVDLSALAGKTITLRLVTDPGPAHNTEVDQAYWADLTLVAGTPAGAGVETPAQHAARRERSRVLARAALGSRAAGAQSKDGWAWPLRSEAANAAVAVVPGPQGMVDAAISFVEGDRELSFDGFALEVDGAAVGGESGLQVNGVSRSFVGGRATLTQRVLARGKEVPLQVRLWAEKGALRVAFSMPGVKRDLRGTPRFTRLQIGPASQQARRVYAGFGNVVQDPGAFTLHAGGFALSTRHSGFDFRNGMSLVQGTDIFPDALDVDPARKLYAVRTHHDATFSFVPSSKGAFAAARVFRGIANYTAGPGVKNLLDRVVLDQWGGEYNETAEGLERAARYGLTQAVFVKHVWQRWGYDFRLPDIYPPAGDEAAFLRMVNAARNNGILFAPHDNYSDFYPDATGFSYDKIVFNADGTPQLAWYHPERDAQSYRWLPTAFMPWLERNLKSVEDGFAPTAYFVDVFSAIEPFDFYDRSGRFYPKTVTVERWNAAFDRIRAILGNDAPMISESGTDALVGHLDAGESDHPTWLPPGAGGPHPWQFPAADGERTPWHDMVTHGNFALLAGGLGVRYAATEANAQGQGYGSDNYLSMTVLGGRVPMSDGPFSRTAVMTYWLLRDISSQLGRREMLTHQFVGDDIHRQSVGFSGAARVLANRGKTDWTADGRVLPQYGFVARAGDFSADVSRRDGVISALSQSPGALFADARPPAFEMNMSGRVKPRVTRFQDLGGGRFRLEMEWEVVQPMDRGWTHFVHFADPSQVGEAILFQGSSDLNADTLTMPGATVKSVVEGQVPAGLKQKTVAIRHGFYNANGRFIPFAPTDDAQRARAGLIDIAGGDGAPLRLTYRPETPSAGSAEVAARLNVAGKIVDFGAVKTNGAFRLQHSDARWTLMPLPFSAAFQTTLQLDRLNARGKRVVGIDALNEDQKVVGAVPFTQNGEAVRFTTSDNTFALRLRFAR